MFIPHVYLGLAFNIEKVVLNNCRREGRQQVPVIQDLKRSWKWRSEEVEEAGVRRKAWTIFVRLITFLECEIHTQHTMLVASVDQYEQKYCSTKQTKIKFSATVGGIVFTDDGNYWEYQCCGRQRGADMGGLQKYPKCLVRDYFL